ncbi:hypothetical protein AAMO2058_000369800 [Amorphochlora amoebiformis]|uniref:FAD/NAD(P)-binding domain-containing protein n=1 Tax=Amorphochlora amoebiformis TaxID=1561963 RepID=A0A7S0CP62_9EUKA|mmetsp:Transcript_11134/g.17607  ORF Transcript_11134/g.17607 Transcript_11134/m.17607 type:complete len:445 (+) Transcript_11134:49-1383(+)
MGLGSSKEVKGKPVVIIVGAGYGGVKVAKKLDKNADFNVVIIDRKNYFLHNIAMLRAVAVDDWEKKCLIPYDKVLKYGSVVQGEVISVSEDCKSIKVNGREEEIKCDYLVLATGSSYAFPAKVALPEKKDVPKMYKDLREITKKAMNISVIGGGAVGYELVVELAHYMKDTDKKFTLIHSGDKIASATNMSEKFKDRALAALAKFKNIKVMLGERVTDFGETETAEEGKNEEKDKKTKAKHMTFLAGKRTLKTQKGTEIETDLVFFCMGTKVNNASFKNLPKTAEGRLEVNDFLQIKDKTTAFALGDCADIEGKMGYFATIQADTVAKNIYALEKKKKLTAYKKQRPAMFLNTGPVGGVAQLGPLHLGDMVVRFAKAKDLFVSQYWPQLNQNIKKPTKGATEERRKKSILSLENAMNLTEEQAKEIQEKGLGNEKKIQPDQINT